MDYDKIILDLLNRIVTLEDRVKKLEENGISAQNNNTEALTGSKKYRFLSDYLCSSNLFRIKLTFVEIEKILNFELPDSAKTHRTFWANTTGHSIALSWLSVNYSVVEVNLEERYVIFEKMREFEIMKKSRSTVTTEDNYLSTCKNYQMVALYKKLKETIFDDFENVGTGATSYYSQWNVSGMRRTRQFVNFEIQKEKIRIITLSPISQHNVGKAVPDTHNWTLDYRTDIYSEEDIEKVKGIIIDSYNQVKHLV